MLVSLIVPCYNVSEYIKECLASVFDQTYPTLEVICVDNNSTDSTYEQLLNLKEQFHNLIIERELKPGASAARNKGLKFAKGEWIQFLDADDLLKAEKIEHQVNLIKSQSGVALLAGSSTKQNLAGAQKHHIVKEKDLWLALSTNQLGNTCANLFQKEALLRINGWNESLQSSQETDLMFRLLQNGAAVCFDNKPLTIIREREAGSISQLNIIGNLERYIRLRYNIYKYLVQVKYNSEIQQAVLQIIFNKIRELYTFDATLSLALYKELIPAGFKPILSTITSKYYIMSYHLVGFKSTESAKAILRKLFKWKLSIALLSQIYT